MAIIVQKFGGTSVGDATRMQQDAAIIANCAWRMRRIVMAISGFSWCARDDDDLA